MSFYPRWRYTKFIEPNRFNFTLFLILKLLQPTPNAILRSTS